MEDFSRIFKKIYMAINKSSNYFIPIWEKIFIYFSYSIKLINNLKESGLEQSFIFELHKCNLFFYFT